MAAPWGLRYNLETVETSTLHSIPGLGELHVVRSPEKLQIKGLWYLTDVARLEELLAIYETQEVVLFEGLVTVDQSRMGIRQPVQVKIRSLETTVDEATGEVQVTASLYALTADDFVL